MVKTLGFIFAFFAFLSPVWADSIQTPPPAQPVPHVVPSPPKTAAEAYILIDYNSGKIIASQNADMRVEPASLTKIMTGYVVINELSNGNISLDDMVTISPKAWKMPGSKMFIEVGKKVSVHDLIKGMVIQSGNDASVALAEHIAGSEEVFAELMNKYAESLGMAHTHYMNATGLPNPDHYTTAEDLSILARALINKFPEEYEWYAQKKFTFNGITQYNRNKLLWQDPSVDGLKTGHTESAGYCLVTSAKRDDMRLISVVLGTDSAKQRIQESQKLLNYGFRFFETHKLYQAGQRLNDARIWEGQQDTVGLGLENDLYVTIPRGQYKNLKIESTIDPKITAPVNADQPLGELTVSLNDETISQKQLVSLSPVEEGSFFKKILDQIKLLFKSLLGFLGL
ncbi:D-alanyl-D-alanine carboxypeptidase family protein [Thiomicrospira sp. S5]|jgi:D-alanyl-D-alanine carboxypeptidase (penicillin-binding protein 5/6)|uniref:D-alanyl-D-alanine carboxypeptidase family protein n=1 Tax=Thiomicrospira sp. S5 TaxID=1803865 RepID=UPI000F8A1D5B|nr:D-alanyl-D-alanine carboxypeptidase family protein [Thiomicrospira sp. S5]AZR81729.1 D-alanyl-D-alanine carboxypeptidase [Thiomicrospira sp. S5]